MLIAHLPAGYLLARSFIRNSRKKSIFVAALLGSIFPDLDMLWFHLIDNRQTHHHEYITHWPMLYFGIALFAVLLWKTNQRAVILVLAFCVGALLHMALDTIAAPMMWLAPFSDYEIELVEIPATQPNWILSFIFHWTFLNEIALCLAALILMIKFPNKAH